MIVYRCPCCKILNRAPKEHAGRETYCLKCLWSYRIPAQSEEGTQDQDVAHSSYLGDNLFDPYSEHYGPDINRCYEYHVFISYANVDADREVAAYVADRCVSAHWRTFYAPHSMRHENRHQQAFCSRWCGLLEHGLLSSCHLLGVLSPAHLASAYCDLEIQGFLRIASQNPARGIVMVLSGLTYAEVPSSLQPFVIDGDWNAIERQMTHLTQSSQLRLGKAAYAPVDLFDPLPITSDVWRFGFGPEGAKEKIFELYVRECMVLILKGLDPTRVNLNWPMLVTDEHKAEVLVASIPVSKEISVKFKTSDANSHALAGMRLPVGEKSGEWFIVGSRLID